MGHIHTFLLRPAAAAAIALVCCTVAQAQLKMSTGLGLNRYGSSGYLTIPTADIAPAGSFDFSVNRAFEPIFDLRKAPPGRNLSLVVTPYDNVEIGGRMAEYGTTDAQSRLLATGYRDLSGNVKIQFNRAPDNTMRFALGVQDVAGGAVALRGAYGVFTMDIGPLAWSAGAIKRDSGGKSGGFAGVKLAVWDPLYVMADVDPYQKAIGARANVPLPFVPGKPELSMTLARSYPRFTPTNSPGTDVQLALRFALAPTPPSTTRWRDAPAASASALQDWPKSTAAFLPQAASEQALTGLGLESVQVRTQGPVAVATLDNTAFSYSHFDAVAVALTVLDRQLPSDVSDMHLLLRAQGIAVARVYAKREAWRRFAKGGVAPAMGTELQLTSAVGHLGDVPQPKAESPVRVRVEPVLRTFMGTEYGAVDVALAARVTAVADMAALGAGRLLGSVAVTSGNAATQNFEKNGIFHAFSPDAGLTSAMLHWAGHTGRDVLHVASVGKHDKHFQGAAVESHWLNRQFPMDVDGTLSAYVGHFKPQVPVSDRGRLLSDRTHARVHASGYIPALDLSVDAGIGQFQARDRGPSLDVTRDYGPVNFGIAYRKTDRHFFGIQMGVPLAPRHMNLKAGPMRLQGSGQFTHGVRTSYIGKSQNNAVIPTAARMPEMPLDAKRHLLDRGRLSLAQWFQHIHDNREFANTLLADAPLSKAP